MNSPPPPAKGSGVLAAWSLVLGILSITCLWLLGSIPAIILGILALGKTGEGNAPAPGRGQAIAGIVTGSVGAVAGLLAWGLLASLVIPAMSQAQHRAQQAQTVAEMKTVVTACHEWAVQHEGDFPPNLESLVPDYLDESALTTTDPDTGEEIPYRYRPGLSHGSPSREPVLLRPATRDGWRAVAYVDETIERDAAPLQPGVLEEFE